MNLTNMKWNKSYKKGETNLWFQKSEQWLVLGGEGGITRGVHEGGSWGAGYDRFFDLDGGHMGVFM